MGSARDAKREVIREDTIQRLVLAILIAATLAAVPCSADKGKAGKGKAKGKGKSHSAETVLQVSAGFFSSHEQELIQGYFAQPKQKFPPGLAKRGGSLPPGLEKQLRRKGHLPPGLEKKISPMPYELEHRLPRLEPGLHRGFIDGKAIIYNQKTRAIIDIFAVL